MNFQDRLEELGCQFLCHEPLARHTTFRIGGPADYYVMPDSVEQCKQLITLCKECEKPYRVIGNGSNILCADDGVEGVIIDMVRGLNQCEADPAAGTITAQAGVLLSTLSILIPSPR